jgi:hypothetical protein
MHIRVCSAGDEIASPVKLIASSEVEKLNVCIES